MSYRTRIMAEDKLVSYSVDVSYRQAKCCHTCRFKIDRGFSVYCEKMLEIYRDYLDRDNVYNKWAAVNPFYVCDCYKIKK